ncbi:hypothetical protein ACWGJX_47305, partial [Streptomyces sp. NPDC054775]
GDIVRAVAGSRSPGHPAPARAGGLGPGLPGPDEHNAIMREMQQHYRAWGKLPDPAETPTPYTGHAPHDPRDTSPVARSFGQALLAAHEVMPAQHRPALNIDGGLIPDHITDFTHLDTPTQNLLVIAHHLLHHPDDLNGAHQLAHHLTTNQTGHPRLPGSGRVPDSVLSQALDIYYGKYPGEYGHPPSKGNNSGDTKGIVEVEGYDDKVKVKLAQIMGDFAVKGRIDPSEELKKTLAANGLHVAMMEGSHKYYLRPTGTEADEIDVAQAMRQTYGGNNPQEKGVLPKRRLTVNIRLGNSHTRPVNLGFRMHTAVHQGLKDPSPELRAAYEFAGFRFEHDPGTNMWMLKASAASTVSGSGPVSSSRVGRPVGASAGAGGVSSSGRRGAWVADGRGEGSSRAGGVREPEVVGGHFGPGDHAVPGAPAGGDGGWSAGRYPMPGRGQGGPTQSHTAPYPAPSGQSWGGHPPAHAGAAGPSAPDHVKRAKMGILADAQKKIDDRLMAVVNWSGPTQGDELEPFREVFRGLTRHTALRDDLADAVALGVEVNRCLGRLGLDPANLQELETALNYATDYEPETIAIAISTIRFRHPHTYATPH